MGWRRGATRTLRAERMGRALGFPLVLGISLFSGCGNGSCANKLMADLQKRRLRSESVIERSQEGKVEESW